MLKVAIGLLMVAALLSGCAQSGSDSSSTTTTTPESQYQSGVLNLSAPVMPREPRAGSEINLTHAPAWRLGEWWTYTMTDGFTGSTYEFTRVVAGEDRSAGNYLIGFPADAFSNDVMLFHVPGYGDIAQASLGYETHDSYFQPLSFPLAEGNTWEVEFEGTGLGPAVVNSTSGTTAEIHIETGGNHVIDATYDATIGEISKMHVTQGGNLYATYEVTGHGYDYQGLVRVPHAHDLVFIHGRLAGAVNVGQGGGVAAPSETVVVAPGYDRLSFIIAVGGGAFTGLPAAGVFQEEVVAPNGTTYSAMWTPADIPTSGMLKIVAIGHDTPEGEWTMNHMAAGAGIAFVEGIGYHSIDVDLPSGCVVASFNANHHLADCKTTADQAGEGSYT